MVRMLHRIKRVKEALDVGRSTVYRLIESGDLQTVHIGRCALVTDESLRAYVDGLTANSTGQPGAA